MILKDGLLVKKTEFIYKLSKCGFARGSHPTEVKFE